MADYLGIALPATFAQPSLRAKDLPPRKPDRFGLYADAIRKAHPEVTLRNYGGSVQPDEGVEDDIVDVNRYDEHQRYVFRFPRTAASVAHLHREIALLAALQGRVPLPVPNPIYSSRDTSEVGQAFMGYARLPGRPLVKEMLESLPNADTMRAVATQLAAFLHTLHHLPADEFAPFVTVRPLPLDTVRIIYERAQEELFPSLQEDERAQIEKRFEAAFGDPQRMSFTPALVHGAFVPPNILHDAQARAIGGIIGFGRAGVGDPASDFAPFFASYGYGEEFVRLCEAGYPELSALLDRARFYASAIDLDLARRAATEPRMDRRTLHEMRFG